MALLRCCDEPTVLSVNAHLQIKALDAILSGPPVRKILFMDTERRIQETVLPHFEACLAGADAEVTQAVDTMLEVVPKGMLQCQSLL